MTEREKSGLSGREGRYRTLVRTLPDAVIVTDVAGLIQDVSQQTVELFSFQDESDLIGRPFFDLVAPESKARAVIYLHQTLKQGISRNLEYTLVRGNGEQFIGEVNTSLIRDAAGRPEKFVATTRDVTSRIQADKSLKTSIREKEVLLQEIHHRVKNNLQIIASLLDMSRLRLRDPQAVEVISDACSRIQSMAFIHSQLYRTDGIERIEMGEHVRDLVGYLSDVYTGDKRITPYIDIQNVRLSLTQAVPCALVLNELISNAFKHAFGPGDEGIIEISMRVAEGRHLVIQIRDNGRGIEGGIQIERANSLGLKLVRNLVEHQLKGHIQVRHDRNTEFTIELPLEEDEHGQNPGG